MNAKSDEGRIYELENQLKTMHFTTRDDISLFISENGYNIQWIKETWKRNKWQKKIWTPLHCFAKGNKNRNTRDNLQYWLGKIKNSSKKSCSTNIIFKRSRNDK